MPNGLANPEAGAVLVGDAGSGAPADRRRVFTRTFAALQHRNYRLYFFGQLVSLVGTWMQMVAQGWLVYQLTNSPLYLGLVSFAASIPVWALSLGAGVVIDRVPRRYVLIATQTVAMLLAFVLAALVFARVIQPWHILILSFLLGISQAFDGTARQAFVKDMVGKEDLMNAIALNSALFNMSRIIGPALAGIALASVGAAWCFFLNGLSFLAVIAGLMLQQMPKFVAQPRTASVWGDIQEGLRYIRDNQTISTLILIVSVSSVFGFAYAALLPAYAQDVVHVDAQGLGFLSTASGLGALCGALMVAALSHTRRKGVILTVGNLFFPLMLILFSLSRSFPLSLLLMAAVGWGFMIQNTTANTLVQSIVPDRLRGRVMSVYNLAFFGLSPIGSLQAGFVAQQLGVPIGLGWGAVATLLFGLFILWRVPRVRLLE
ncbi:MAG: MFS transporter [Chloroflexi bacterium]|nr:MFS transporter [Chloroflexota bacterium]